MLTKQVLFTSVAVSLSLESCRATAPTQTAVKSSPTAPAVDLTNSAAYDPIVDDPTNPLLTDLAPITEKPDSDQTEDMRSNISPALLALSTQPLKYGEARTRKPKKFAGATVLAALRRLRRYYYTVPFETIAGSKVDVTVPNSVAVDKSLKNYPNLPGKVPSAADAYGEVWNTDGVGNMGSNLRSMPAFWSDLQAHFYVMAPHTRHGCWTSALNAMKGGELAAFDATPVALPQMRQAILDVCTGQKVASGPAVSSSSGWRRAITAIPYQMSAYNLLWVDPVARKFIDLPEEVRLSDNATDKLPVAADNVPKLTAIKWSQDQRDKGYVNVWDYIMLSQLYAFDYEQQNAVLNAYFADHKKWSGDSTPFNPLDKADCAKFRAPRPGDPFDGTQCDPNRTLTVQALSPGR